VIKIPIGFIIVRLQCNNGSWKHFSQKSKKIKCNFKPFPACLVNNGREIIDQSEEGSLRVPEGHRLPAELMGKTALMLRSCHFSSLTKTPSATGTFAASESEYQWFPTIRCAAPFTLASPLGYILCADGTALLSFFLFVRAARGCQPARPPALLFACPPDRPHPAKWGFMQLEEGKHFISADVIWNLRGCIQEAVASGGSWFICQTALHKLHDI